MHSLTFLRGLRSIIWSAIFTTLAQNGLAAREIESAANAAEWFKAKVAESGQAAAEKEFLADVVAELDSWINTTDPADQAGTRTWFAQLKAVPALWAKLDALAKQAILLPNSTDPQELLRAAVYLHLNEPKENTAALYFDKLIDLPIVEEKHERVMMTYFVERRFHGALEVLPDLSSEIVLHCAPEITRVLLVVPTAKSIMSVVETIVKAVADPAANKEKHPIQLILSRCFVLLAKHEVEPTKEAKAIATKCCELLIEHKACTEATFSILLFNPDLLTLEQKETFAWKCLEQSSLTSRTVGESLASLAPVNDLFSSHYPIIPDFYLLKNALQGGKTPEFWARIEKLPGYEKGGSSHEKLTLLSNLCGCAPGEFLPQAKNYWDSQLQMADKQGLPVTIKQATPLLCEAAVAQRRFLDIWKLFWSPKSRVRDAEGIKLLQAAGWRLLEIQAEVEGTAAARKTLLAYTDYCLGPMNSLGLADEKAVDALALSYEEYMAFWRAAGGEPSRALPFFDICERGVLTRSFPKKISVHIPINGIDLPPAVTGWPTLHRILAQSPLFAPVKEFSLGSLGYAQSGSLFAKVVDWVHLNPGLAKTIKATPNAAFGERLFASLVNPDESTTAADIINQEREAISQWEMYRIRTLAIMIAKQMERSPQLAKGSEKITWLLPWQRIEQVDQMHKLLQISSAAEWKGFMALQKNPMSESFTRLADVDPHKFWQILEVVGKWGGGGQQPSSEYSLPQLLSTYWTFSTYNRPLNNPTPELLKTKENRLRLWRLVTASKSNSITAFQTTTQSAILFWAALRNGGGLDAPLNWAALLQEISEAVPPESLTQLFEDFISFEREVAKKYGPTSGLSEENLLSIQSNISSDENCRTLTRLLRNGLRMSRAWWEQESGPNASTSLPYFYGSVIKSQGKEHPLTLTDEDPEINWLISKAPQEPIAARLNYLCMLTKAGGPALSPSLIVETSAAILQFSDASHHGHFLEDARLKALQLFAASLSIANPKQSEILLPESKKMADFIFRRTVEKNVALRPEYTDSLLDLLLQLKDAARARQILDRPTEQPSWRIFMRLLCLNESAQAVNYWRRYFTPLHLNVTAIHAPTDILGTEFRDQRKSTPSPKVEGLTPAENVAFKEDLYYMERLGKPNASENAQDEPAFLKSSFDDWWASIQGLHPDWKLVLLHRAWSKGKFQGFFPMDTVTDFLKDYKAPAPNKQPSPHFSDSSPVKQITLTGLSRVSELLRIALARSLATQGDWEMLLASAEKSFADAATRNQAQIDAASKQNRQGMTVRNRQYDLHSVLKSGDGILAEYHWWLALMRSALTEWPKMQPVRKLAIYDFLWETMANERLLAAFDPYQKLGQTDPFSAMHERNVYGRQPLSASSQIEDAIRLLPLVLIDLWEGKPDRTLQRCLKLPASRIDQLRRSLDLSVWEAAIFRLTKEFPITKDDLRLGELAIQASRLRYGILSDSTPMEILYSGRTPLMPPPFMRSSDRNLWNLSTPDYTKFIEQLITDCRQTKELANVTLWTLENGETQLFQKAQLQIKTLPIKVENPSDFWLFMELACRTRDMTRAKELLAIGRQLVAQATPIIPSSAKSSSFNPGAIRPTETLTATELSGKLPTWKTDLRNQQSNLYQMPRALHNLGLVYEAEDQMDQAWACYALAAKYWQACQSGPRSGVLPQLSEIDYYTSAANSTGVKAPVNFPIKHTIHDKTQSRMAVISHDFPEQAQSLKDSGLSWSKVGDEVEWVPYPDAASLKLPARKLIYQQFLSFNPRSHHHVRLMPLFGDGVIRLYINGVLVPIVQTEEAKEGIRRVGIQGGIPVYNVPTEVLREGKNEIVWFFQPYATNAIEGQIKTASSRWIGYRHLPEVWAQNVDENSLAQALPKLIREALPPILPWKN